MPNNFAQIGGSVNALLTKINLGLNEPVGRPGTVIGEFAFVDEQLGKSGSEICEYPLRVLGQKPKRKGDTEARDYQDPIVWSIKVGSSRLDIWAERYPLSESRDPYGMFKSDAPDGVAAADVLWQELVAELLNGNGRGFDEVAFFGPHKANKAVLNSSDFENDIANLNLDEDGVIAAFQRLQEIKGPGGQLANPVLVNPFLLCPTQKLYRKALKLQADGAFLAKVFGANTAAASETSSLSGEFTPILMPQLNNPAVAATAKRWYAGIRNGKKRRGVIVRVTQRARFQSDMTSDAADHDAMKVWCKAEGEVAFGLPHTLVRATEV